MHTFKLVRDEDVTGVSGTGIVAEGVEFSTGWVALTWLTAINSLVFYPSIDNVEAIHGHDGKTRIEWDDALQWKTYELSALRECIRLIAGDEVAERIEQRLCSKMLVADVTRHMES